MNYARFQKALKAIGENDFWVLDTETTGLGRLDQVAQVGLRHSNGEDEFCSFVKPTIPMPEEVIGIHGITDEMLADAPSWEDVRREFYPLIRNKPVFIYHAAFDLRMLRQTDIAHNLIEFEWDNLERFCAMDMVAFDNYSRGGGNRSMSLSKAAAAYGVEVRDAHSAMGDVAMTMAVIQKIYAKSKRSNHNH